MWLFRLWKSAAVLTMIVKLCVQILIVPLRYADDEYAAVWPECVYSPQSAVEGRVYLVSRQEADAVDELLDRKQVSPPQHHHHHHHQHFNVVTAV